MCIASTRPWLIRAIVVPNCAKLLTPRATGMEHYYAMKRLEAKQKELDAEAAAAAGSRSLPAQPRTALNKGTAPASDPGQLKHVPGALDVLGGYYKVHERDYPGASEAVMESLRR